MRRLEAARAVAAEARFLEGAWRRAAPGRGRVTALAALIGAGLALIDGRLFARRAPQVLSRR